MTNQQIKEVAMAAGFKLKQQPDGSQDLNPYVYDFARTLIADDFKRGQQVFKDLQRVEKERNQLRQERDALAAWKDDMVTTLDAPVSPERRYVHARTIAPSAPRASLARRDARMKAEALEDMANAYEDHHEILDHLRDAAEAYRKQAEDSNH